MKNYPAWLSLLATVVFSWGCPPNPNTGPAYQGPGQRSGVPDTGGGGVDVGSDLGGDVRDDAFEPDAFEPDAGPEVDYPEVDVWAEGGNNELGSAVPIAVGQTFGGVIEPGEGEDYDVSVFSIQLEAGTVFSFWFTDIGEGMMLNGAPMAFASVEDQDMFRGLNTEHGMRREAFIPLTGTYYIVVGDRRAGADPHGGPTSYFAMESSSRPLQASATPLPGTVSTNMNEGVIRAYALTPTQAGVISAETFAMRPPVRSELNTVIYAWNPTQKTVVAFNDDVDFQNEIYDSRVVWGGSAGETYWVIADAYTNPAKADLQLLFGIADDDPDLPRELNIGASLVGEISAALNNEADSDDFRIVLAPGQNVRVQVEASNAMQPLITVHDSFGREVGSAAPVAKRAAITFGLGADQGGADGFRVLVRDRRNVRLEDDDMPQNVGGADYGYTISAALAPWSPTPSTLPLTTVSVLETVGTVNWHIFNIPAGHIVELAAETAATGFQPWIGQLFASGAGYYLEGPSVFVQGPAASAVTLGVRDRYFRGGASYTYTPLFRGFDPTTVDFAEVESSGAASIGAAQTLTLPVGVIGTLDGRSPNDLRPHHYRVALAAGQTLVMRTEGGPETDTRVRLVNAQGQIFIENDFHLGQAGTYYSAFVYDIETAGDYFLIVEPFCTGGDPDGCEGNGDFLLELFDGAP